MSKIPSFDRWCATNNARANPPLIDRHLTPDRGASRAKEMANERAQAKPKATLSIHGPTVPERQWIKILEDWRLSGVQGSQFCRRRRNSYGAFHFWKKELPDRERRRRERRGAAPRVSPQLLFRRNVLWYCDVTMRLGDIDFDGLIPQMWGSEANLRSFLETEVVHLCARICGPDAPVPKIRVTQPTLKGEIQEGVAQEIVLGGARYQWDSESSPPTIVIPILIAGNKSRLPQFIAFELIHHWEALGAIGEADLDYPEAIDWIIKECRIHISEEDYREWHSQSFLDKAAQVARDLEIPLRDFLFPTMSLTISFPLPEEGPEV